MNNLIEGYRPDDWIERFNDGRWSWIVFTDDLRILYERQDSNMIIFWKE